MLVELGADRARAPLAERAFERAAARGFVSDGLVARAAVGPAQLEHVERARQDVQILEARALGRAHERAVVAQERKAMHGRPLRALGAVEPFAEGELTL